MMSYIPEVILKPVAAMTSKCGFNFSHQVANNAQDPAVMEWNITPESIKDAKTQRCVSTTSTVVSESLVQVVEESASDEEVCKRMAQMGRKARKVGRHILVNGRLVLS